ncbi:hypothetical protein F8388_004562 [Cannabis sativa]|uniref:Uncharacterized protein n=1 Tax=Cannabis sativa TaxID=3483 RepID=A0A7J6GQF3_CANSA|nr:hypothetical protein F8388_004562 [Cannabis sativa]
MTMINIIVTIMILCFPFSIAITKTNLLPFKKIYAFGDSFTDTGNTRSVPRPGGFIYGSNPPYGMTFFTIQQIDTQMDGWLLTLWYNHYHCLSCLLINIVNFAIVGSTAIDHEFFVKNDLTLDTTPESIQTQLLWFDKYLEENVGCKAHDVKCRVADIDDSLFWVGEIGANDYAYTFGSTFSSDTIRKLVMNSYTQFLTI